MIRFILALALASQMMLAEVTFAEPKPSMENPRRILFSIVKGDDKAMHHVLSSANNVLKFYGPENVEMRIVAYSDGIKALLKKERAFAKRVDALMQYDVSFVTCGNTMRTKKIKKTELLDDVEIVTAGIVEIIERVKEGWIYIKP